MSFLYFIVATVFSKEGQHSRSSKLNPKNNTAGGHGHFFYKKQNKVFNSESSSHYLCHQSSWLPELRTPARCHLGDVDLWFCWRAPSVLKRWVRLVEWRTTTESITRRKRLISQTMKTTKAHKENMNGNSQQKTGHWLGNNVWTNVFRLDMKHWRDVDAQICLERAFQNKNIFKRKQN